MLLSKELKKLNIECECYNENDFESLGLAGYNHGDNVLTFAAASKYLGQLTDNVCMVLTTKEAYEEFISEHENTSLGFAIVDNPRLVYFLLHNCLCNNENYKGGSFTSRISPKAQIHPMAYVSPVGVIIEDDVVIEEFVSIKAGTHIQNGARIRAGSIVGGIGFEVKSNKKGNFIVEHVGKTIISENVDIAQNVTIDRAIYPWDATIVGNNVMIADQAVISHGVKIGSNVEIAAGAGIMGRVTVGENSWIGPNSTIRNGISVGKNARVNMGAVVTKSVKDGEAVSGNFAIEHSKFINNIKSNR